MKLIFCILLPLTVLLSSGCGTVKCLTSSGQWNPLYQTKPPPSNAVYGGARWDLKDNPSDIAFWDLMNDIQRFLDLPFSFVADTVVLPYTLISEDKPAYPPYPAVSKDGAEQSPAGDSLKAAPEEWR